jgi:hypothetical protein
MLPVDASEGDASGKNSIKLRTKLATKLNLM